MLNSGAKRICVLPGDGIGPEVIRPAVAILERLAGASGLHIQLQYESIGGDALDRFGVPLPEKTLATCRTSDAILLGAVGGPKWDSNPPHLRPEKGLLEIRKGLGLYGNLRPVRQIPSLVNCSTLKPEVVEGIDLVVVRELTGGLYFGEPRGLSGSPRHEVGMNTMIYHRFEVERIARKAFALARLRRKNVASVDKANVLEVSRLWREVVEEVHGEFQDVELSHQYVDNCAMQMVLRPKQFDVVLTENTFGDILSDIGGVLTGSIGTLPSASIGDGPSLFEPVHGSAPDIAGKDLANPIGAIGCVAMMFEISFARPDVAGWITRAVDEVLRQGYRTQDLAQSGGKIVGTNEFVARIQEQLGTDAHAAGTT
jgi:3-isopropylmalate dehydrogenase